jgi:hypothetical protein
MNQRIITLTLIAVSVAGVQAARAAPAVDDPLEAAAVAQAAAQAEGATRTGQFLKGNTPRTDFNVMLDANRCYWFSGVTAGKVEKLALYLWAPGAGTFTPRLTSERSESGKVVLAWCTKVAGMYKFQAKIEGSGEYVVGVFQKDAPRQADPPPTPPPPAAPEPTVDVGAICDKVAKGAAPAAHRVGDFFDGKGNSIGHDDRFDYPIQLDAGSCYWIVACGEPGKVKSISLYLWDPANKRVTDARGDTATPIIGHCARETGMYKFQAKITGGGGAIKSGLYAK